MITQTLGGAEGKEMLIPNSIVVEADSLSKETCMSFRFCLELLFKQYLASLEEAKNTGVRTLEGERPLVAKGVYCGQYFN